MPVANGRRVAVIAGCRTPFCRSGSVLKDARAVDLARFVARELLERTNLDGADVNAVIFGQVVPSALVPNVAREVSLLPQFPKEIPAYSLNRACASSGQAVANAYDEIVLGDAEVVLAGGVESLSDIPILATPRRHPGGGEQGQVAGRAASHTESDPAARPRSRVTRHRRALDRRVDGPVGGEDGQGEPHLARGAGSLGAPQSRARGPGNRR